MTGLDSLVHRRMRIARREADGDGQWRGRTPRSLAKVVNHQRMQQIVRVSEGENSRERVAVGALQVPVVAEPVTKANSSSASGGAGDGLVVPPALENIATVFEVGVHEP